MKDDEIKSAFEIAMEKASRVPGLSRSELEKQKELEFTPRGTAIAKRYLEHIISDKELVTEQLRFTGKENEIVTTAVLNYLIHAIDMNDLDNSQRALKGIQQIKQDADLGDIESELQQIASDITQQREQNVLCHEERAMIRLKECGISGSAVKLNLDSDPDWKEKWDRIRSEYLSRVNRIKRDLSVIVSN